MAMLNNANIRALSARGNCFASDNCRAAMNQLGRYVTVAPELHCFGLVCGALRAFGAAKILGLVVIAGIERTLAKRERRSRPELVGALRHPWFGARVLGEQWRGVVGTQTPGVVIGRSVSGTLVPSAARSACTAFRRLSRPIATPSFLA